MSFGEKIDAMPKSNAREGGIPASHAAMESNRHNLDRATVDDFGREWQRFDQSSVSNAEVRRRFGEYFALFPWDSLPRNAVGFAPAWFRLLWRASDLLRHALSKAPFRLKSAVAELLAACVYWPLARGAWLFERLGGNVADWPLSAYRGRSYYAMRTDALDRFGTRLEHRMTQAEIRVLMENAGLGEVRFSDGVPFWCAIGRKI